MWIEERAAKSRLSVSRIDILLGRYGTTADAVIAHIMQLGNEALLDHVDGYTDMEVDWIARNEMVENLADIVMRRTTLAIEGRLSAAALDEISGVAAAALGWSESRRKAEIIEVATQLSAFNRVRF